MWPFTKKPRTKNSSFAVGPYSIDTAVDGIPGLREATDEEYAAYGRRFSGERIFHAPRTEFLGFKWKMLLGTVNSRIYKVAPYIETTDKQMANRVAFMTMSYCNQNIGPPAKQETGLFIWDTSDGNIILQTAEVSAGFGINLFITSSRVRSFQPLR